MGTYTAINGGTLRCMWTDGSVVENGSTITVFEVGGSGGLNPEKYSIRSCHSATDECTPNSDLATGDTSFVVDGIL